jgi:hypothetical protein
LLIICSPRTAVYEYDFVPARGENGRVGLANYSRLRFFGKKTGVSDGAAPTGVPARQAWRGSGGAPSAVKKSAETSVTKPLDKADALAVAPRRQIDLKEPGMDLPTFATLINNKVVIQQADSPSYSVDQHFFQTCMAGFLNQVQVDEAWYLAAYPDVAEALKTGQLADCKAHFVWFGYYEHRMPRPIEVDEAWYLKVYPDIEKAVERQAFASGQDHFNRCGYSEGRMPYANFSLA